MKKIATILLLGVPFTTIGWGANNATGFYAGVTAGLADTYTKYWSYNTGPMTAPAGGDIINRNYKTNSGKMNPMFGLFAGYGIQKDCFYYGAELVAGADFTKVKVYNGTAPSSDSSTQVVNLKNNFYYGLSARLGWFVTQTALLFTHVGFEGASWKFTSSLAGATIAPGASQSDITALQTLYSSSKNSISPAVGIGVDLFTLKNMFVRFEYTYVFGVSLKGNQNINAALNITGSNLIQSLKTSQGKVKVGIACKF